MEKIRFLTSCKVLIPCAVLAVLLTVFMPRTGEFEYHYSKGSKWNYETLLAPFNFPILKTQEQILREKEKLGATYVPYYKFSEDVFSQLSSDIENMFPEDISLAQSCISCLAPVYERGVLPEESVQLDAAADVAQDVVFVQMNKRAAKVPVEELYDIGQVYGILLSCLKADFPEMNADSVLASLKFKDFVRPNLDFDRKTTELVHQKSSDFVSPTSGVFKAGDVIVSSGEIITSDIAQILDSFKAEFHNSIGYDGPAVLLWAANLMLALILSVMVVCLVVFICPEVMYQTGEFYFILLMFLLCSLLCFACAHLPAEYAWLMPFPVFAMYFMAFFRKKVVVPLYILLLLPLALFCQEGIQLYLANLFAGFAAVCSFSYFNKGWRQFITALFIFLSLLLVFFVFQLREGMIDTVDFTLTGYMAIASVGCILAYALVYLFEIIFGLVSVSRLVDLSDTSNSLLRELASKAPGTFQHSLAVMNMADAAGRSVDANVPLLRAASLYHDVGKILNPQCFIENQNAGVNYHGTLSFQESASEIIRHVADGEALAQKHGIPKVVRDFISTHHGTSSTGYFYSKYLNEGGDPQNVDAFFYPGPKPRSKEQVILMMCDSLEAGSRTLSEYSKETVSAFVRKIYMDKYRLGQFDDADITLHEFDVIIGVLEDYIVQSHHARIAYPKRNNNK